MNLIKETFPNLLGADVVYLNPFEINDEELKSDGVHLRDRALARLKSLVKENINLNMVGNRDNRKRPRTENAVQDGDEIEENLTDRQILLKNSRMLDNIGSKLFKTDEKIETLEAKVAHQINKSLIQTARMSERMDGLENRSRRNFVVLRLVKIDPAIKIPEAMREKADFLLSYITLEIGKISPIAKGTVGVKSIFLIPAGGGGGYIQDVRLLCSSNEDAVEIRQRLLKAKEDKVGTWTDVEISNDPVKATRVRISLMQAVTRQINKGGDQEAVVSKYLDSPTLIIRNSGRVIKNLSFVDTILQYGEKLSAEDLQKAAKIAGRSFPNQMECTFLILKDDETDVSIPTPCGVFIQPARGNGRGRGGDWRGRGNRRGRGTSYITSQPTATTWAGVVTGANATPITQPQIQQLRQFQQQPMNGSQSRGYFTMQNSNQAEFQHSQRGPEIMTNQHYLGENVQPVAHQMVHQLHASSMGQSSQPNPMTMQGPMMSGSNNQQSTYTINQ